MPGPACSKRAGRAVGVLIVLAAARAAADPATPVKVNGVAHLASASAVHTDGGADLRLPPGYFLDEPSWTKLNTETRRLQDAETRLNAENRSFRASASSWQPGWITLATALGGGIALGWYLEHKL